MTILQTDMPQFLHHAFDAGALLASVSKVAAAAADTLASLVAFADAVEAGLQGASTALTVPAAHALGPLLKHGTAVLLRGSGGCAPPGPPATCLVLAAVHARASLSNSPPPPPPALPVPPTYLQLYPLCHPAPLLPPSLPAHAHPPPLHAHAAAEPFHTRLECAGRSLATALLAPYRRLVTALVAALATNAPAVTAGGSPADAVLALLSCLCVPVGAADLPALPRTGVLRVLKVRAGARACGVRPPASSPSALHR